MKAVISIAARMASTRLPGKVMAEVAGKPILQHLVERLSRANAEVVISNNGCDPEIRDLAAKLGVRYVAADVDVMAIHQRAIVEADADFLCIAGADDPLLDPAIFDMVIDRLSKGDVDYVRTSGWPLGLNVWGVTRYVMNVAAGLATAPDERQHVVPFWERRPNTYPQAVIRRQGADLYGKYRLTVDTADDLAVAKAIYFYLLGYPEDVLAQRFTQAVLGVLLAHPQIASMNADGLQGTAARDAIYPDLTPVDEPHQRRDLNPQPIRAEHERPAYTNSATLARPDEDRTPMDEVRRHVQTERQAALAAVPERGSFAEGQAAALLSMDQWLQYKGDL